MPRYRVLLIAFCSVGLVSTLPTMLHAQASNQSPTDWVPYELLTEEEKARCPRGCGGMYIEPQGLYEGDASSPNDSSIDVVADFSEIESLVGEARMSGSVVLNQGWRTVRAQDIVVLQEEQRIEMVGGITMREPGLLVSGASAQLAGTSEAVRVQDARFVLHDIGAHGGAQEVGRTPTGAFYILNTTYSTCEPGENHWVLEASEIRIDEDEIFATARNVTLRVANVPVFYTPWFSFPVGDGRKTGILYPSISGSQENGLDITQPIYLNLAPNYDLTLAPRYIEKRGIGLEIRGGYLNEQTLNQVSASFLPHDSGGNTGLRSTDQRWYVEFDHIGNLDWAESAINFDRASDNEYFSDLGTGMLDVDDRIHLRQSFELSRYTRHWTLVGSLLRYQNLSRSLNEPYRELPKLRLDGRYTVFGLDWQLNHEIAYFDHSQERRSGVVPALNADADGDWVTGSRMRVEHRVGKNFFTQFGATEAELFNHTVSYQLSAPMAGNQSTSPSVSAGGARLRHSVTFERNAPLFGREWLQTIEPQVQYLLVQAQDQSDVPLFDTRRISPSVETLFRPNRFIGGDRVGDTHQVTTGLTGRLFHPSGGNEIGRLSVGQAFFLGDREVHANELIQLNLGDPSQYAADDPVGLLAREAQRAEDTLRAGRSGVIVESDYIASANLTLSADAHMSADAKRLERNHLNVRWHSDDNLSAIGFAYRYVANDSVFIDRNEDGLIQAGELFTGNSKQLDFTGIAAVKENWNLFARVRQDIALSRPLETLAGVQYEDCCWSVSFIWRRWLKRNDSVLVSQTDLRHDSGIFVTFELKGLGGVGSQVQNLVSSSVPGFNRERY